MFTAFHRVANSGWYVVSSIPIDALVRPLQDVWLGIGVLAALGLLLSFGSAVVYGNRLAGAFRQLDAAVDTMGKGCPIEGVETGVRELDRLGSTLTQVSRDLQALTAQRAELLGRLIDSQENERLRLSHELHDQTGSDWRRHSLNSSGSSLSAARNNGKDCKSFGFRSTASARFFTAWRGSSGRPRSASLASWNR